MPFSRQRSSRIATDFSDYAYISVSACPSQATSPVLPRRDSILKHSGSVKTEKRVSIKYDTPIMMEFISEKRPPAKPVSAGSNAMANGGASGAGASAASAGSSARPASLLLTNKGDRSAYKLVRSPSIEEEYIDIVVDPSVANNRVGFSPSGSEVSGQVKDGGDFGDDSVPLVMRQP